MKLHTVLLSYHRQELTAQALETYLETVTVPHTIWIVDNGSDPATQKWVRKVYADKLVDGITVFPKNRYPGPAVNEGFLEAPGDATHFHRADNDFVFLSGWSDHVKRRFELKKQLGQLGLRTDAEELYASHNVGGNMIVRRELWDAGLRYDERPWPELPKGYSEDSFLSPAVKEMGWDWGRVLKPCIRPISSEDPNDPYYQQTWRDRGIIHD